MSQYAKQRDAILADFSASEWLKRAVLHLEKRDPLDAQTDCDTLADLQALRVAEALEGVAE